MKCPQCGQWNRASLPNCIRCGAPLNPEKADAPAWQEQFRKDDKEPKKYIHVDEDGAVDESNDQRDELATDMTELKERKVRGSRRLARMQEEAATRSAVSSGATTVHVHTSRESLLNAHVGRVRTVGRDGEDPAQSAAMADNVVQQPKLWQDTRGYDPLVTMLQENTIPAAPPRMNEMKSYRTHGKGFRRTLRVLITLLIIGLVGVGGFFALSSLGLINPSSGSAASITSSIVDDLAAHTILIPGEDGQQIYVGAPMQSTYPVVDGFATVEIPDYLWYRDLPSVSADQETMHVTLKAFLKTANGRQKALDPIEYDITIPLSPVTLITPESLRYEVTTAMYSVELQVRPGSTVTITKAKSSETVDVSDTVSEDGDLIYNATVQPIGDNKFTICVRAPYCRENTLDLVLYREVQEIPLDLAVTTYASTSKPTLEISATTRPGATVDVLTSHTDLDITDLDTTGEFKFVAVFDKIGDNTITITASYPGQKTSRVDYTIYYVPDQDKYTRQAWPLNNSAEYSELVSNITYRADHSQVYLVVGTIAEIISEKPQTAIIYTADDGKSRPVVLENKSKTTWAVGDYLRIYCDAYGTYNSYPWLIARYTYN